MKNLVEVLKDCPSDVELYCTFLGTVIFKKVKDNRIICTSQYSDNYIIFNNEGQFVTHITPECDFDGECCLFPSKDNKNWDNYTNDLPINTIVGVFGILEYTDHAMWYLAKYKGNGKVELFCACRDRFIEINIITPVETLPKMEAGPILPIRENYAKIKI